VLPGFGSNFIRTVLVYTLGAEKEPMVLTPKITAETVPAAVRKTRADPGHLGMNAITF
jgi:hypothetical protein